MHFVFALLLTAIFASNVFAKSVSHFNLVDASKGAIVTKLSDGDTIYVDHPFTIEAVLSDPVPLGEDISVAFRSPWSYTARSAPYYLPGWESSTFRSESLLAQSLTLIAYPDENWKGRANITVDIRPTGVKFKQLRGPISSGRANKDVPLIAPNCQSQAPPKVEFASFELPYCDLGCFGYGAIVRVKYCAAGSYSLRLMQIQHDSWYPQPSDQVVEILNHTIDAGTTSTGLFPPLNRCGRATMYAEACVRTSGGDLKCSTSRLFNVPAEEIDGPLPAWRPPFELQLHPGDRAAVVLAFSNDTSNGRDGFSNGHSDRMGFKLFAVTRLKYGRRVFKNGPSLSARVKAHIPPASWKKGVFRSFNDAKVELEFTRPGCDARYSLEGRYATQVKVSKRVSPLALQDTQLPRFKTPVYPPTVFGQSATMRVVAENVGGGERKNGEKTKLSYQWYVRTQDGLYGTSYAEKIVGATGSSITFADARCNVFCPSRYGVIGLHIYYVDVCNTFGCKRSKAIFPNILPPTLKPGEEWDELHCTTTTGYSCSGGQTYCVQKGLVQEC